MVTKSIGNYPFAFVQMVYAVVFLLSVCVSARGSGFSYYIFAKKNKK